ncbi:MAG TPA: M56 family metallopeptidase [Terracidiphilus sp.]|jgi:Zn-dependent protease with chaperone function
MNQLILHAVNLSAGATGALVSAIWEGALLAAIVFLILRMLPGLSASARSVIWLNVFILLALLHVTSAFTAGRALPEAVEHGIRLDARWSLAIAGMWLAVSLVRISQLVVAAVHLRRMAQGATPVEPPEEIKALLIHNGCAVRLCTLEDVARPGVLGFFRPRILVPPALLSELSEEELRQVILHEMEHLHRGDDWTNLLQKLALVLFPLNPALAWVERRLCAERELACDDRVLRAGSGRKAYALCLTHLAEFALVRRGFSLVLGAWERRPELVRRVERILSEPARSMGRRPATAVITGLTAGALACTLMLARSPQLVRFASPVHVAEAQNASTAQDAQELGRELGGKPQFVKATLPASKSALPARHAVVRKAASKLPTPSRLADLRMPPPPDLTRTMLIMTDWDDDMGIPPQVVFAVARARQHQPPLVIRTTFAVVRTPMGWLVIQI